MEFLLNHQLPTPALVIGVILLSWLWEDLALICCALLAADGRLSVLVGMLTIFVGISSGDFALYGLGRFGRRWRWLRYRILRSRKIKRSATAFKKRVWSNIFVVRFIPGLRTVCFTSCGYWRVDLNTFVSAMLLSGLIWVVGIFSAIFYLGSTSLLAESSWKWALVGLALVLLMLNNVAFKPLMSAQRDSVND